ncbi:hypothetical protein BWI96_08030 [Siphonobacter sp. SORGH_AS_0500]|uniref:hypothetical protein n=1 Tax=Siphonobacter sp. SORGH_AS_0500 TaxID=1864824 RepID=UPI000CC2528B|nr:hypothetical protein [Siphonobacter sp. SORGH_AS_0500]PKK37283.1 hypothetical protein BWI96_08030 [Siphonobacter sp. SORGH_AS_0500]
MRLIRSFLKSSNASFDDNFYVSINEKGNRVSPFISFSGLGIARSRYTGLGMKCWVRKYRNLEQWELRFIVPG